MILSYRGGKMFQSDQRARINLVLWYFYILLLIRKYYLDVSCNKPSKEIKIKNYFKKSSNLLIINLRTFNSQKVHVKRTALKNTNGQLFSCYLLGSNRLILFVVYLSVRQPFRLFKCI